MNDHQYKYTAALKVVKQAQMAEDRRCALVAQVSRMNHQSANIRVSALNGRDTTPSTSSLR